MLCSHWSGDRPSHLLRTIDTLGPEYHASLTKAREGFMLYLNGEEIYRVGMVEGEVPGTSTPAAFAVEEEWEGVYSETLLWPTHLKEGRNQLAMEVHRAGNGDADLFADIELLTIPR